MGSLITVRLAVYVLVSMLWPFVRAAGFRVTLGRLLSRMLFSFVKAREYAREKRICLIQVLIDWIGVCSDVSKKLTLLRDGPPNHELQRVMT